jgi:2-C-methyl-D-erythritol 4-phosphate cytidylyltransferase
LLSRAYANVKKKKLTITDESSSIEALGEDVHLVPAPLSNIKITTPEDLALAGTILKV